MTPSQVLSHIRENYNEAFNDYTLFKNLLADLLPESPTKKQTIYLLCLTSPICKNNADKSLDLQVKVDRLKVDYALDANLLNAVMNIWHSYHNNHNQVNVVQNTAINKSDSNINFDTLKELQDWLKTNPDAQMTLAQLKAICSDGVFIAANREVVNNKPTSGVNEYVINGFVVKEIIDDHVTVNDVRVNTQTCNECKAPHKVIISPTKIDDNCTEPTIVIQPYQNDKIKITHVNHPKLYEYFNVGINDLQEIAHKLNKV